MVDLKDIPDRGLGPFPDTPEEIFAEIGCRLVLLQDLEMFLTVVVKLVFEEDSIKARDAILKSDKKTMGQLLYELRKQVRIADDFDLALKRTLDSRNSFVHEFSHKYNLTSQDGVSGAIDFLLKSMQDLEEVTYVMKTAIVIYGHQRGVLSSGFETNWRTFGDLAKIESKYIPKIAELFRKKPGLTEKVGVTNDRGHTK